MIVTETNTFEERGGTTQHYEELATELDDVSTVSESTTSPIMFTSAAISVQSSEGDLISR